MELHQKLLWEKPTKEDIVVKSLLYSNYHII